MAGIYRDDSLYRNTGLKNAKFLDILEPVVTDKENYATRSFTLSAKYNNRPDVLAYDLYGNAKLWWVFAEFNPDILKDPIMDFVSGLEIQVPNKFS